MDPKAKEMANQMVKLRKRMRDFQFTQAETNNPPELASESIGSKLHAHDLKLIKLERELAKANMQIQSLERQLDSTSMDVNVYRGQIVDLAVSDQLRRHEILGLQNDLLIMANALAAINPNNPLAIQHEAVDFPDDSGLSSDDD